MAPVAVAVLMCLAGAAQAKDENAGTKGRHAGQQHTIRGVVVGVTEVGETVINFETNRGETARTTLLTVIGSPVHGKKQGAAHAAGKDHHSADATAESKDATNPAAGAHARAHSQDGHQSASARHRENLYVLEITPRTKIRFAEATGQETSRTQATEAAGGNANSSSTNASPNTAGTERSSSSETLVALEIGDHVRVTFTTGQGAAAHRSKSSETGTPEPGSDQGAQASSKHGRNRTFYGEAVSITVLPDRAAADRGAKSSSQKSGKQEPAKPESSQ